MADPDTPHPATDADLTPPPADASFEPAEPLKDAGVAFEPESKPDVGGVRQQLTSGTSKLGGQAGDRVRQFADMGKERAAGALDQLATMLTDAAGQVDGKLGAQYGGYARSAADAVQGFSAQVREQDLDELVDQGRELVRKSPAIAIGTAAAIGFVLARLIQSGVDADHA
ncbi:hypothetical protein [Sphingomonas bacterium]|uniref:hypothetical protein n=1 Tax=Sphingomonas bacterium TaxID=1895847 RepID=UPI0015760332|nr:hypothetical protein [Sphingomonas bacterium]